MSLSWIVCFARMTAFRHLDKLDPTASPFRPALGSWGRRKPFMGSMLKVLACGFSFHLWQSEIGLSFHVWEWGLWGGSEADGEELT
jgi:hypothetical protein